jgi:Fic family protein
MRSGESSEPGVAWVGLRADAFSAYDSMQEWSPHTQADLFAAHKVLMAGLVDKPGRFRTGGAGVHDGDNVIHIARPPDLVPGLINDLLGWLRCTDEHPLIVSSVFNYELGF